VKLESYSQHLELDHLALKKKEKKDTLMHCKTAASIALPKIV
jgi:hypothetical protein